MEKSARLLERPTESKDEMHLGRVFFDYDRIEMFDEEHSYDEDRYDTIGDISAGYAPANDIEINQRNLTIGNLKQSTGKVNDILFVVYTERVIRKDDGKESDVTRLISARLATNFERGLYYGKY